MAEFVACMTLSMKNSNVKDEYSCMQASCRKFLCDKEKDQNRRCESERIHNGGLSVSGR